jgi:hypothetical protein
LRPIPGPRRPLAPPFSPEQLTGLAIWHKAGDPQNTDTGGAVQQPGGSFGTPAAILLGARYNAGPFNHAEADVPGVRGATEILSAADQPKLIDWAGAKWGV